jgi:hypothetical protein
MGAGGAPRSDAERRCRFATRLGVLNAVGCGVVTSPSARHSRDVDAMTCYVGTRLWRVLVHLRAPQRSVGSPSDPS